MVRVLALSIQVGDEEEGKGGYSDDRDSKEVMIKVRRREGRDGEGTVRKMIVKKERREAKEKKVKIMAGKGRWKGSKGVRIVRVKMIVKKDEGR